MIAAPVPENGNGDAAGRDRGLSTARAVLQVLTLARTYPFGITANDVARHLGKSVSTAYHLLASLETEGFLERDRGAGMPRMVGRYRVAHPHAALGAISSVPATRELRDALDRLSEQTRRRAFLALPTVCGVEIVDEVGRQGLPRLQGVEEPTILRSAHALAVGKVWLSELSQAEFAEHTSSGLTAFTALTITSRSFLETQLAEIRTSGIGFDDGEYDERFACLAAPVRSGDGRTVAVLSVSMTRQQFAADGGEAAATLISVAAAVTPGLSPSAPARP